MYKYKMHSFIPTNYYGSLFSFSILVKVNTKRLETERGIHSQKHSLSITFCIEHWVKDGISIIAEPPVKLSKM